MQAATAREALIDEKERALCTKRRPVRTFVAEDPGHEASVIERVGQVAPTGDDRAHPAASSGVGKELVARALHEGSKPSPPSRFSP